MSVDLQETRKEKKENPNNVGLTGYLYRYVDIYKYRVSFFFLPLTTRMESGREGKRK